MHYDLIYVFIFIMYCLSGLPQVDIESLDVTWDRQLPLP